MTETKQLCEFDRGKKSSKNSFYEKTNTMDVNLQQNFFVVLAWNDLKARLISLQLSYAWQSRRNLKKWRS